MLGRKRHQVVLLKKTTTVSGNGEAIDTFVETSRQWCEIRSKTAREIEQNGRFVVAEDTLEMVFRRNPAIDQLRAGDQISKNGTIYEPTGNPRDPDGRDRQRIVPVRVINPSAL